jgi:hypothetical protein
MPIKLPREGAIRVWRLQKPILPDASAVPAHEGSRDVAVPWEPATSSSVARGEEATPPPKGGRKGRIRRHLDWQSTGKIIGVKAIRGRNLRYVVF